MNIMIIVAALTAITITSTAQVLPAGGSTEIPLMPGSMVDVVWTQDIARESVDLELWDGERSRTITIARAVPAEQKRYTWTLPPDVEPGRLYRFVVRDAERRHVALFSPSFVHITRQAPITTTVPMDDDDVDLSVGPMPASDEVRCRWTAGGYTEVSIVDVHGTVRMRRPLPSASTTTVFDVRILPSGAYTVLFHRSDGGAVGRPIVIRH
jgi:hypothetical protein